MKEIKRFLFPHLKDLNGYYSMVPIKDMPMEYASGQSHEDNLLINPLHILAINQRLRKSAYHQGPVVFLEASIAFKVT